MYAVIGEGLRGPLPKVSHIGDVLSISDRVVNFLIFMIIRGEVKIHKLLMNGQTQSLYYELWDRVIDCYFGKHTNPLIYE